MRIRPRIMRSRRYHSASRQCEFSSQMGGPHPGCGEFEGYVPNVRCDWPAEFVAKFAIDPLDQYAQIADRSMELCDFHRNNVDVRKYSRNIYRFRKV